MVGCCCRRSTCSRSCGSESHVDEFDSRDDHGQSRKRFGAGQVYHEAVHTTMQARNGSATQSTELILFQVGGKGEPLMIVAKPPGG